MKKMKALKAYKIVDSDGYNYPVTKATLLLLLQEHDDFNYSTPQELDRAEARDIGRPHFGGVFFAYIFFPHDLC